jgi:hypothetical protein
VDKLDPRLFNRDYILDFSEITTTLIGFGISADLPLTFT